MAPLRLFIPLTKIDIEKRLVYGVATAEEPDRENEVCDYATTKPYYKAWSDEIAKSTGGKSIGNLRAMHQRIAAGKVTEINYDDEGRKIEICAKVVDDGEWNKCVEGVYTGFSQGGRYVKRWDDGETGVTRYTADPTEISLVDLPCLPSATFTAVKADGATELRKFKPIIAEPATDAIVDRANAIAKAAGGAEPTDAQLDEARNALLNEALAKMSVVVSGADVASPTEQEIEAKAAEIATSEGADSITDDHRQRAQAALMVPAKEPIQDTDSDSVRALDVPDGDAGNGATSLPAEEGLSFKAAGDEPVQTWTCNCAEHRHLTKAQAKKCIRAFKATEALKAITAPLESALDELNRTLGIERPSGATAATAAATVEAPVADPAANKAASGDLGKDAPSREDRMAQHKAMTGFHAAQDGDGHMAAAAAHAEAYQAQSSGSSDAEDKTQKAFQASRDCMGAAAKDASIDDLAKTAGYVKDVTPPPMMSADKAAVHASMANFHAKQAATGGPNADLHKTAAAAHADAFMAHATGAADANDKSDAAFDATTKCVGAEKAAEARALFEPMIGKAGAAMRADALRSPLALVVGRLGKGLPTVARLASLIEDLKWVSKAVHMESKQEGDDSPVVSMLDDNVKSLCATLVAMVDEETKELVAGQNVDDLDIAGQVLSSEGVFAMAASLPQHHRDALCKFSASNDNLAKFGLALDKAAAGELETSIASLERAIAARADLAKAGRRNSTTDLARIQKVHDLSAELGADCGNATGKVAQVSLGEALEKLEVQTTENSTLKAALADHGAQLEVIRDEVKKLKASPAPAKAAIFPVSKDVETARATGQTPTMNLEDARKVIAALPEDERRLFLTKLSLANPTTILR